jgi:predicted homoserine dehydrogenase-like protein
LTRRAPQECPDFPSPERLTNSVDDLIEHADVCVECSGDALYGTDVLAPVMAAGLPVVTMDAELQVTTGSYFARRGMITEAEGDQPGCLAALRENALRMGFRPLVYGNIKGFLNLTPTPDEMRYWSERQGISLTQVTAFTDGTKVQIEQALVANGLGAGIALPGLLGVASDDLAGGARTLADFAQCLGHPLSDYVLSPRSPAGVFIVAEHDEEQRRYLQYLKMGEGPYYVLLQPHHLCHLEIVKTIRRVLDGGGVLLNNGANPSVSVAAVAKEPLRRGEFIPRGIGSFQVRGIAVDRCDAPEHVPIGLLANAVVTRDIGPDEVLTFDSVELPESLALDAWRETVAQARPEPHPISSPLRREARLGRDADGEAVAAIAAESVLLP